MSKLLLLVSAMAVGPVAAEPPRASTAFVYDQMSQSPVAIPLGEQGLQTVVAEPWLSISKETPALAGSNDKLLLEGAAFDREGDLLLVEIVGGRVLRISPNRTLSVVLPKNTDGSAGIAVHKDGRIFVAGIGDMQRGGCVFAIRPDGSGKESIISRERGYIPDDLVFDNDGGFYFTDLKGNNAEPIGGVFYMSPDRKTLTPVMSGLSMPDGIALSPNGKVLWVGETGKGLLHRIELSAAAKIGLLGTTIPYHFTGARADSVRVDADGNVYVGLFGEGRVLVFNPKGVPIGQLLVPGREDGKFLYTTSMAIKPGTKELYILASDQDGRGAMIFRSSAFSKAPILFSHQ
ncbi:SMP-30/gluconolactonase/LRE family protein [Rhizorhabdus argentea]|uniref:SMP-30/gluconolactonase/LRE family protein n=1 Tax=Rhizorhabdus argentea TaxID=1387174 RepID=UPI0030EC1D6C